jgi:hypothetical protein
MNYKQMLEKFEELEAALEAQDARIKLLEESFWLKIPTPPQFTPGTLPQPSWPPGFWYSTSTTDNTNPQDGFQ